MRYLFFLILLGVLALLARQFVRRKLRALRGEPEPAPAGPRNITLLAGAIVLVYAIWLTYRLVNGS